MLTGVGFVGVPQGSNIGAAQFLVCCQCAEPLPQLVEGVLQLEVHTGSEEDLLRLQGEEVPFSPRGGIHLLHYSDSGVSGTAP